MYTVFMCKSCTRTLPDELVKLRIKGYGDGLHMDNSRVPYREWRGEINGQWQDLELHGTIE
jgi:hypothetical protein